MLLIVHGLLLAVLFLGLIPSYTVYTKESYDAPLLRAVRVVSGMTMPDQSFTFHMYNSDNIA